MQTSPKEPELEAAPPITVVTEAVAESKLPEAAPNGSVAQTQPQTEILTQADADADADAPTEWVTGSKLVIIMASVALACFLMLIDTSIVSTAIPSITDEFNSLPDVGWYASAYQFGSAAPQPLTGKIYSKFRTKWVFLFFFGIFELGSVLCGAAVSSTMLIVGRAVAGIGAAGIINGTIIIISGCVPLEKRPGLIGATVGFGQLGLAVGPLIGGAFSSYTTWRWCFYINLPVGALTAIVVILLRVPEQTTKDQAITVFKRLHHHLDLVGFFLFAPSVLQLLLALQYGGNQYAWNSSVVIGLLCGAGINFIVWLFWNHYMGDDALLPHSLVKRRVVWVAGVFQALFMSAIYGALYYLPIYFQAINNASALLSGVYLLPTILPELFSAAIGGGLLMKIGYVIPPGIVSIVLLAVSSGLYSILRPGSPTGWWVGFQLMNGVGSGLGLNLAIIAVQATVTPEELSSAMSFIVFAQSLGPAIALILCNVIFISCLRSEVPKYAPSVDANAVIKIGATGFRSIVSAADLPGVLTAYADSVDRVFYLVAALAAVSMVVLFGFGWSDLRPKDEKLKDTEEQAEKQSESDP